MSSNCPECYMRDGAHKMDCSVGRTMSSNEHGYCPNCGMDFDGGLIWDTFFDKYGDVDKADEAAASYGATRETGKWGLKIGIYDMERDMTTHWKCPDCGHEWPRST